MSGVTIAREVHAAPKYGHINMILLCLNERYISVDH